MTAPDPAEVVRHEERLRLGTVPVPVERVRVQKVVVTEERTITVTVRREELRLVREPLDPDDTAQEAPVHRDEAPHVVEMVLHEERVVVDREVVPVERVRVVVDRVTTQQPVVETLRHEEVVVDGDVAP